jgi:hypothetical protein
MDKQAVQEAPLMEKEEGSINYCVCHDGSPASDEALEFVKHSLLRENKDCLEIAHAWSKVKEEYLYFKYKRDYIKER